MCKSYMNEFDRFVKHRLKAKHYIRYADDFVFLYSVGNGRDRSLQEIANQTQEFLQQKLKLRLHPQKVFIQTTASGVDFLGWVNFPDHKVLRTKTKKRMMKEIKRTDNDQSLQSYLGLLKHGDTFDLRKKLLNDHWLFGG